MCVSACLPSHLHAHCVHRALSGQVRLNQSFISRAGAAAAASERQVARGTAGPAGTVHEEIATGGKARLGETSIYESRDSYRDSLLAPGALRQRLLVVSCNTSTHTLLTSLLLHSYFPRIKVVCSLECS
jgi:hypothetical protein